MYLPKQAVQCSLLNIAPLDGISWSKVNTKAIDNCFNADKYKCIFHDIKNNKYSISLINEETDVGNMLVEQNLASFNSKTKSHITAEGKIIFIIYIYILFIFIIYIYIYFYIYIYILKNIYLYIFFIYYIYRNIIYLYNISYIIIFFLDKNSLKSIISCDIERVDINLLNGQTLRVNVSSVENASKFYIQIPSATECEKIINTYMADKNPKVCFTQIILLYLIIEI